MGTHDVVIKVQHQVVDHHMMLSLPVSCSELELKIHVDPGSCPLTCLLCILAVHPQVGRIIFCGMNPLSQSGLCILLELLTQSFPDLI